MHVFWHRSWKNATFRLGTSSGAWFAIEMSILFWCVFDSTVRCFEKCMLVDHATQRFSNSVSLSCAQSLILWPNQIVVVVVIVLVLVVVAWVSSPMNLTSKQKHHQGILEKTFFLGMGILTDPGMKTRFLGYFMLAEVMRLICLQLLATCHDCVQYLRKFRSTSEAQGVWLEALRSKDRSDALVSLLSFF